MCEIAFFTEERFHLQTQEDEMRFSFFFAALLAATVTQGASAASKAAITPLPPKQAVASEDAQGSGNGGVIAFTFDIYGTTNPLAQAMPALASHQMPATVFLTTGSIGQVGSPTWDDVKGWIDKGFEVDSRGDSNKTLVTAGITDDAVRVQIIASAAKLARFTGVYPTAFSAAFGKTTDHVTDLVRPYYKLNVLTDDAGSGPKVGFNDLTKLSPYRVSRLMVTNQTAASDLCEDIAWTARGKRLLVIGFGNIEATASATPGWYDVSADNFNQILDCTAALVQSGSLKVVTLSDALSMATLAPPPPPKPKAPAPAPAPAATVAPK